MSIINDALKKAQQERKEKSKESTAKEIQKEEPKAEAKEYIREDLAVSAVKKKPSFNYFYPLFIIGAIVFISFVSLIGLKEKSKIPSPPALSQQPLSQIEQVGETYLPPSEASKEQLPAEEQRFSSERNEFVLSGIVYGWGSPMAIINGSVYVEGEAVKNARILEITENMVVLVTADGKRIELRVK